MTKLDNKNQLASDKEALLALLLKENQTKTNNDILKADRTQPLPLSFTQERLWFIEQLDPGSSVYNMSGVLKLSGNVNVHALQESFQDVVTRHEVLRTIFTTQDGEPIQCIKDAVIVTCPVSDISDKSCEDQEAEIVVLSKKVTDTAFDLEKGPLLRLMLIKLAETEYRLLITMHHIIADGWGLSAFFHDLSEFYKARVLHSTPNLDPIEYQYADFAYTQRKNMQGQKLNDLLTYWKNQLAGIGEPLDLPSDRPRPDIQCFEGGQVSFNLPTEQVKVLKQFGRQHNTTLFMTLLAVFKVLLYRYTGHTDIIVGTPAAQRDWVEMEGLVGVFVNNLLLRTQLSGNPCFESLLGRVSDTCLEAFEHQNLPFERLVEELKPQRDRSRNPLFQVMFVYLNAPSAQLGIEGLSIEPTEKRSDASEYDLSFYVRDKTDTLECRFEYSTALYDESTIHRMKTHFLNLLQTLVENPETPINHSLMLADTERNWLVNLLNDTAVLTPEFCLHELISKQSLAHRNDVAVIADNISLTYDELNKRANQLAHFLMSQGVETGVKVGVLLDRDENMLVGLLGILKAGGAYVPIDPMYPMARIEYMMKNSCVPLILTTHHLLSFLPQSDAQIVCFDLDSYDIEQMPETDPEQIVSADQLAYVIYTSGTTGQPKGVQVTHANAVNFIQSMSDRPGFSADDVLLAVTTISFDIHVLELFLPLVTGGKVVVASQHVTQNGDLLLQRLMLGDITVMQATPATWQMLIQVGWEDQILLKVLCGGEKMTAELAADLLPRVQSLWNMYGPTETTVWSSVAEITDTCTPITIGQPINNTQLYITDKALELVPVGVPGELLIGGQGVTQGYLQKPELTQEVFIKHPLNSTSQQLVYRTGDLARYLEDGQIEINGRLDHQVKMRGYRIETGEIEKTLAGHDAVKQAVVILREDQPGDQRLVAYLLGNEISVAGLRDWLQQSLPDYMIPSAFVWLMEYPMTPNNKVDRKQLPAPSSNDAMQGENFVEPQSEMEMLLVNIFKDVLKLERVGCYDNFFDLGGHSLLSMKVVARFEQATGIHMHPGELFQQTIGQIAAFHEHKNNNSNKPSISLKNKLSNAFKSYIK